MCIYPDLAGDPTNSAQVTGWVLIFGCRAAWTYSYDMITGYLNEHYTSSIRIDDDDGPFEYVTGWLAEQKFKKPSRKLKAVTDYKDNNKNDYEIHDGGTIYKYEVPVPRYELTYGVDNEFYHKNRYFKVVRSSEMDDSRGRMKDTLEIFCYGKTTQPVKDLLLDIRKWKMEQETAMTSVYRPLSGGYWSRYSQRPSRSLHTVSLDQDQKDHIVDDINEYLHPATARWYAARGIPHRRGVSPTAMPMHTSPSQINTRAVPFPRPARNRQNVPLLRPRRRLRSSYLLRVPQRQGPHRIRSLLAFRRPP